MKGWMLLLIALVAMPLALTRDRDLIPVNKGFGWDGQMYGMYTQYLPQAFDQKAINSHRIQRLLVPAGLYYVMETMGIPRTEEQVIQSYRVANVFFIALGILAFFGLAAASRWHPVATALGFGALFLSVPVLKMSLFYPLLPDIPAMAMGLVALWCWRRGWRAGLLLTVLFGAFTGPTMILYLLLLLFPRQEPSSSRPAPVWIWGLLPVLYLGLWTWAWTRAPEAFHRPPSDSRPVRMEWLVLALPLALVWTALLGKMAGWIPVRPWRQRVAAWSWWVGAAAVVVLIQVMIRVGSGAEAPPQTLTTYLQGIMVQSVVYPGGFLVAHFQYLPGMVLLGVLAIPGLSGILREAGTGAVMLTLVTGILLMGSETRQILQLLPWVVWLLTGAVDRQGVWATRFAAVWCLGLCAAGRWWERLGRHDLTTGFLEEPAQRYFRFHGPWMNETTWWTTGAALLLLAGGLLLARRRGWLHPEPRKS